MSNKNNDELISVIIPVYNVEKYLYHCIDSVVNQSYKAIEIILVNDGSSDGSTQICDDWSKKDSRIKIIHKQNGGLSDARNAGLKIANGEWIAFVDSDDWVASNYLEYMVSAATAEKSDIVECSVKKIFTTECNEKIDNLKIEETYDNQTALRLLIEDQIFHQHVWNKIYRRSVISQIFFEIGKLNEDEFWTYQIFGNAHYITKINNQLYFYYQRPGSIMHNEYSLRRLDALEAKFKRQMYIDNKFPELINIAKIDFFRSCVYSCQMSLKYLSKNEKEKAYDICKSYLRGIRFGFRVIIRFGWKDAIWITFAKINLKLTCMARNILQLGF